MADLEPIKGLIELTDEFTGPIGLAEAALSNFSKHNQESLKASAEAAGLVTAAITAIAVATIELGKKGSEVNEVNETLEHFAGGASAAAAAMAQLRAGTKGTVDDFILAKDAAHLLSAGVQLTAQDFGTLGQAAFVLKTRGLGATEEQLKLVSDALVTGRTRALSMALGVVDAGDAEERYAKSLGVTKEQLSDTGKVEAKRLEVMRILSAAVKDAGQQERSFGDEFLFVETQVSNYVDELGVAIAKSDVFAAGFRAVETAVKGAFNGDQEASIRTVVGLIESGAIKVLDFAQAAITMARVVEGGWYTVKTVVLGTETVIVELAHALTAQLATVAELGAKVHLVSPKALAEIEDADDVLKTMTSDLASQTAEAAKAVVGHTAFDQTLDGLSQSLSDVRVSMSSAKDAAIEQTKAVDDAGDAAKKNAASQEELNRKMIDQTKISVALQKSAGELTAIWEEYFAAVARHSGTSRDQQVADIEATFNKQVASLDALDPLFAEKYQALRAVADENLNAIATDWDSVKDSSLEGLQQMADKARDTYNEMMTSGLHFSREVMDEQLQKYRDLQERVRNYGHEVQTATETAASGIKVLDRAWVTDADIAAATINKTTIMVKTLAGELISLAEAQKRQQTGGSFDVTSANFDNALKSYITAGGNNPNAVGITQYRDPYQLAREGYSFAEIIQFAFNKSQQSGQLPPPAGPRIPGFAEGGTVMVGERGPEVVRLPLGSTVYPTGTPSSQVPSGGGVHISITNYVNGTAADVARKIEKQIMGTLRSVKQFPAA